MYPADNRNTPAPHQRGGATPPPPPAQPVFQVTVTKHTGALIFFYNQRHTITGSYPHCEAAIKTAQMHNLLFGWWSLASLLWNPISLWRNGSARKSLRQQAEQAHQYAQWCFTYYGGDPSGQHVGAMPPHGR